MRFLSYLVMALSAAGCVSAHCSTNGIPSPNALRLFVTALSVTGNFKSSSFSGQQTGLTGADNICNGDAQFGDGSTTIPALVTRGAQGLFKAILSNQLTNAGDRFNLIDPSWDIVDSNGNCLANNTANLFGCGKDLDAVLRTSSGQLITSATTGTVKMWTGSLCSGVKWADLDVNNPLPESFNQAGQKIFNTESAVQQAYCSSAGGGAGDATNQGFDYAGSDTSVITEIGMIGQGNEDPLGSEWIAKTTFTCTNGQQLLCLQTAQPTQVSGDPQFTGLQGQQFQVHGMPDEYFNLITSHDMQLNSRFTYLASGTCNYNNTECWTHPGTYVDQLGFMFPGLRIKAVAGSHANGMVVSVNDVRMEVATQAHTYAIKTQDNHTVTVTYSQHDQIIVETDMFTITATNSDMFFNFAVSFHLRSLLSSGSPVHHVVDGSLSLSVYPKFPLHGLLGQTWKNARYQHGKMFQGQVDDYMINDQQLFSNKFVYNHYKH